MIQYHITCDIGMEKVVFYIKSSKIWFADGIRRYSNVSAQNIGLWLHGVKIGI